jgi:DNA-directed RNA polymerase specialized sigma24 family protein
MDCGYETQRDLYDRLRSVATRVRHNAAAVAKRAFHEGLGAPVDIEYYVVLSESASFLAFVELGGDSDRPADFPWEDQAGRLVTVATAHVKRDLEEKGSEYHEFEKSTSVRRDAACVDQYRWDVWDTSGRQEREQVAGALGALVPELRARMPAREVDLLIWRHIDGLSQAQIAERLGKSVGAARMAVMRAREHAADVLGDRWRALLGDALATAA